jgi:hypothetical protein
MHGLLSCQLDNLGQNHVEDPLCSYLYRRFSLLTGLQPIRCLTANRQIRAAGKRFTSLLSFPAMQRIWRREGAERTEIARSQRALAKLGGVAVGGNEVSCPAGR